MFFPPSCGGCGKLGVRWCMDCQQNLTRVPQPVCEICGIPLHTAGICHECQNTRPAFYKLRSCAVYKEPIRPALLRLKYYRDIGLGEALAWDLAVYLDGLDWRADAIIPIPLSEQGFSERGYNQVDLIAHPLARLIGWQYLPRALRRSRHTRSQVGLEGAERRKNVLGAFMAEARHVSGKTILLVDDIATTGATLSSASASLMEAGAGKVYSLTVAKALQRYGSDHVKPFSAPPLR